VGIGRSLADFPPMSLPQQQWAHRIPNPLLQAEKYDVDEMATLVNEQRTIFNPDQAAAFDTVLESITNNQGHLFFIHAVGGCGKIFLCNTIAAEVRRRDQAALCVASSGIAALLLDGGKTSHLLSLSLDDSRTTLGKCLGRTRWSSPLDLAVYLYYFYKWLYTTSPRSHVLLECSTIT